MSILNGLVAWLDGGPAKPAHVEMPEPNRWDEDWQTIRAKREEYIAKAKEEADKRRAKFQEEAKAAADAYTFSCRKAGDMLIVTAAGKSHAINIIHLVTVEFDPGSPVEDSAMLVWSRYGMEYTDWRNSRWDRFSYYTPYDYDLDNHYPAPSRLGSLEFVGAGVSISAPHALAQGIYDDVIAKLGA